MQCIIYPTQTDGVGVLYPTGALPVGEVARKDVPAGIPFRIVDVSEIPTDRTDRDLWTAEFNTPDGYGVGPEAWAAEQEQKK